MLGLPQKIMLRHLLSNLKTTFSSSTNGTNKVMILTYISVLQIKNIMLEINCPNYMVWQAKTFREKRILENPKQKSEESLSQEVTKAVHLYENNEISRGMSGMKDCDSKGNQWRQNKYFRETYFVQLDGCVKMSFLIWKSIFQNYLTWDQYMYSETKILYFDY